MAVKKKVKKGSISPLGQRLIDVILRNYRVNEWFHAREFAHVVKSRITWRKIMAEMDEAEHQYVMESNFRRGYRLVLRDRERGQILELTDGVMDDKELKVWRAVDEAMLQALIEERPGFPIDWVIRFLPDGPPILKSVREVKKIVDSLLVLTPQLPDGVLVSNSSRSAKESVLRYRRDIGYWIGSRDGTPETDEERDRKTVWEALVKAYIKSIPVIARDGRTMHFASVEDVVKRVEAGPRSVRGNVAKILKGFITRPVWEKGKDNTVWYWPEQKGYVLSREYTEKAKGKFDNRLSATIPGLAVERDERIGEDEEDGEQAA